MIHVHVAADLSIRNAAERTHNDVKKVAMIVFIATLLIFSHNMRKTSLNLMNNKVTDVLRHL